MFHVNIFSDEDPVLRLTFAGLSFALETASCRVPPRILFFFVWIALFSELNSVQEPNRPVEIYHLTKLLETPQMKEGRVTLTIRPVRIMT